MIVLILVLLVLVALALLEIQRQRRLRAQQHRSQQLRDRTLFDLQMGDIVQAEAADWVVEERLLYDQNGFQWFEYLLRNEGSNRWLVVCEDDWLEVSWLETLDLEAPPTVPLPKSLEIDGDTYMLKEEGKATVTASYRKMNKRPGECQFADYSGPDQKVLGVEIFAPNQEGREVEVTIGRLIDPRSLNLLPGDGRSVYRPG